MDFIADIDRVVARIRIDICIRVPGNTEDMERIISRSQGNIKIFQIHVGDTHRHIKPG